MKLPSPNIIKFIPSTLFMAHSNYRVMPICIGIGEACGCAAAIAVKDGKKLREVKASEIRELEGLK